MREISLLCALLAISPAAAAAQGRPAVVDATAGYAGFVDDATRHYAVAAGAVRKYLTPRLSIGPEFVVMRRGDEHLANLALMFTGNVVYDASPPHGPGARRVTPFVVGGLGGFWNREDFPTGAFWASDPAFTAGAGLRARVTERVSVSGEYRLGWELHHRITASVSVELR